MIKVMSFNIRYGFADDGLNHWHHRKALALERIRTFGPDLLGLQECRDDEQADFLRAGLPDYHFLGFHRGGPGDTTLEMAPLVFRRQTFTVVDQGCFWLSETPEISGSMSWDSAYPRTVTWARLAWQPTGTLLTCVNTHFDYQPEAVEGDARCLRQWLDQQPAGTPLIITGDFNAGKQSLVYRLLVEDSGLDDAFRLADPHAQDEATYHAYGQPEPEEATDIDWILFTNHFRVLSAQIDRTHQGPLFPSDHYPVTAVLDWRG